MDENGANALKLVQNLYYKKRQTRITYLRTIYVENNTTSPEYVQMEVDQNQNDVEVQISIITGSQPGCSKQVIDI
ncbi:hypothetical protein GWI33_020092 [Rhynchophorus ferrugineus]|uniref:Uncharacterized protein n=1 Tax=Rhynchophorus ferrugineus TaxID=354439 RepID=A0A834HUY6_RHYFE|nr:hypothetical protein GWI33_020092 [Rhynchophorus ferrugineus]